MSLRGLLTILVTAIALSSPWASASPCDAALAKLPERVEHLSPILLKQVKETRTAFEAMLILKRFEYQYSDDYTMVGRGSQILKTEQIEYLREKNITDFDLSTADKEETTQFLANGVRQIYLWVAEHLRKELIEEAIGTETHLDAESHHILEAIFETAVNLSWTDRLTTPAELERSFQEKRWLQVPWKKLAEQLSKSVPADEMLLSQIEKAQKSLEWKQPVCCVSTPGCRTCPLNRRYRRP